jgi:hypothetical protein
MTTPRNPHSPYIDAVVDAMTGTPAPAVWWVSDAETGADGETPTLSAVLTWGRDASPDEYPCGLLLCWDLDHEWQHAAVHPDGTNDPPKDLPLPLWAAPGDVAAAAQALLRGEQVEGAKLPEWRDEQALAAVDEWVRS